MTNYKYNKENFDKLVEALSWYGSESLYMQREVETDMNKTSAVFKKEYIDNLIDKDLSKPNILKSISFETTARLKCDQGKLARNTLAEIKSEEEGNNG